MDRLGFLTFCEDMVPVCNGQNLQDLFCLWASGPRRDGWFVEFGALNGRNVSNSYLLETLGWNGIVAEPHPGYSDQIRKNRNCHVSTDCVWTVTGDTISFHAVKGRPALSTIGSIEYDDIQGKAGFRDTYVEHKVPTITLVDLLRQFDAPAEIDCLSIDTEGSELEILEHFDFGAYRFGTIVVEHGFSSKREPIHALLTANGYVRVWTDLSDHDDWYVHASYYDRASEAAAAAGWDKGILADLAGREPTGGVAERWRRLGGMADKCNQPDLALRARQRAIQAAPDSAIAQVEYGHAAARAGLRREATAAYQAALALNPRLGVARKRLALLLD